MTKMIPSIAWFVVGAYFVRALFLSKLFDRETTWFYRILYSVLVVLNLALCIVLSPAQIYLFPKSAQRSERWIETVPETDEHAELDIVAVHDLGSTPETAWSHGDNAPHWLRHFLPKENGLNARILLYYHNSQWKAHALDLSTDELARDLLEAIRSSRHELEEIERRNRPLIFIGYGFGGILVKKAMLLNTQAPETIINPDLMGCIFLSTPHAGSALANAGIITTLLGYWSASSPHHLKNLREGSELLLALQTEFRRTFLSHGHRIFNCRGTGHEYWLGIPLPQVVTRINADLGVGRDISVDVSHFELGRVHDRQHPTYQKLLFCVQDLAEKVRRPALKLKVESASRLDPDRQSELLRSMTYAVGAVYDHYVQSHKDSEESLKVNLLATMQGWAENFASKRGFWTQVISGDGNSTLAIRKARKPTTKRFRRRVLLFPKRRGRLFER